MTQEQKDLLLKDLCARLPYGVKIDNMGEPSMLASINHQYRIIVKTAEIDENSSFNLPKLDVLEIEDVRPYLFPLSSMTEEQKEEYVSLQQRVIYNSRGLVNLDVMEYTDWCYKHHIDINGLIPMGLANDATGKNIY